MSGFLHGFLIEDDAPQLKKSVRFRPEVSAYMSRNPRVSGNSRIWTWSGRIKRTRFGVDQGIFCAGTSPGGVIFLIGSGDNLRLTLNITAAETFATSYVLRDPFAWYHVVLAVDTTQAVAADRVKVYVRGVRLTAFTSTNYPALNATTAINTVGQPMVLGQFLSANYSGMYLADVNFVDGLQLTPDAFGSFDPQYPKRWIYKPYTGAYGVNGSRLKFEDTSSLAALGYDSNIVSAPYNFVDPFDTIDAGWAQLQNGGSGASFIASAGRLAVNSYGSGTSGPLLRKTLTTPLRDFDLTLIDLSIGYVASSIYSYRLYIGPENNPFLFQWLFADSWADAGSDSLVGGSFYSNGVQISFTASSTFSGNLRIVRTGSTLQCYSNGILRATVSCPADPVNTLSITAQVTSGYNAPSISMAEVSLSGMTAGNDWSVNNFSLTSGPMYDSMVDTPNNNYVVLNPLRNHVNSVTLSEGNLGASVGGNGAYRNASSYTLPNNMPIYLEATPNNVSGNALFGLGDTSQSDAVWQTDTTLNSNFWYFSATGTKVNGGGVGIAYGTAVTAGTPIGMAFNPITGKVWFRNAAGYYASGDPVADTGAAFTGLTGKDLALALFGGSAASGGTSWSVNFGQRPFAYSPPVGFKAPCTENLPLPASAALQPWKHFEVLTHAGNDLARSITGAQFKPGFLWPKSRTTVSNHRLMDEVRGFGTYARTLASDTTAAEVQDGLVTEFIEGGFSIAAGNNFPNASGQTYVDWLWKAGGAPVANNNGATPSLVSANVEAGFSVVSYVAPGSNTTVGHGLTSAPKLVITARRNLSGAYWGVYHASLGAGVALYLQTTDPQQSGATYWNSTPPTSSVFSLGTSAQGNSGTYQYVAYCFAEVPGYSKFGVYNGGDATPKFIYTGFTPAYLLIKRSSGVENWYIYDSVRDRFNPMRSVLEPNLSNAEGLGDVVDFVYNGFVLRSNSVATNSSSDSYIYAAFAAAPLKYSDAV